MRIVDTTTVFQVLKAYHSNDVSSFTAGLAEMDQVYGVLGDSKSLSRSLCQRLGHLIITEQKEKIEILEAILEKCYMDMGVDFEIGYHHLRKDKSDPDLLRVIHASGYKGRVPRGLSGGKAAEWLVREKMFD
jgi:hypothetical protein